MAQQDQDTLIIEGNGESRRERPLSPTPLTIGRKPGNDIILDEGSVSSQHARLEPVGDGWQVVDLGSTNGSYVGRQELTPHTPHPWPPGEPLRIGPFTLLWKTAVAIHPPPPPPPKQKPAPSSNLPPGEIINVGSIQLEPLTSLVAPGARESVQVRVANESAIVDHFSLEIEGLPADWVTFSDNTVQLMPDRETAFRFAIQPPAQTALAQTYPFRLILRSVSDSRVEGNAFGCVTIKPVHQFAADISPRQLKNSANCQVRIRNNGNEEDRFTVMGKDPGDAVHFDKLTRRLTIPAGKEERINFRVSPVNRPFTGGKQTLPFEFQVKPDLGEAKGQQGQLEVSPRLPRWLSAFLIMFIIGFVGIGAITVRNVRSIAFSEAMKFATRQAEDERATATVVSTVATATRMVAEAALTATWMVGDDDADGLSNEVELRLGTDPQNPDTDNDGLLDGAETPAYADPLDDDTDDDRILDGTEVYLGTKPDAVDSDGDGLPDADDPDPAKTPTPTPTPTLPPAPNVLPNASFELPFKVWTDPTGVSHGNVRIPGGWFFARADNKPNTLNPHTGDFFLQPESGPVSKQELPPEEHDLFIFEGEQAMKIFKDDAPIYFSMFKVMDLDPGAYRFGIKYFADSVVQYRRGVKEYATDPLAAEVQLCIEGAQYDHKDWEAVPVGKRGALYLDFVVPVYTQVILYASFRNRFEMDNNGWFLDDWSITKIAGIENAPKDLPSAHACEIPR